MPPVPRPLLPSWLAGEFLGTFLLVFAGNGAVCASVLTGAQSGVFQVAIVWGLAIAIAIQVTGSLGGAHLNPAVTLALAAWNRFPPRRVLPYLLTQTAGAFAAAAVLHVLFSGALAQHERTLGIPRGAPGSEASAMVHAEFFPNPGGQPLTPERRHRIGEAGAFAAETAGTAVLVLVILAVGNPANRSRLAPLAPYTIGLTATVLISILGPLTMACFNPARDLGPRLLAAMAGWGGWVFAANGTGWLTVYIAAPILGGLLGGLLHRSLLQPGYAAPDTPERLNHAPASRPHRAGRPLPLNG